MWRESADVSLLLMSADSAKVARVRSSAEANCTVEQLLTGKLADKWSATHVGGLYIGRQSERRLQSMQQNHFRYPRQTAV
jgi:hypothetical protein